MTYKTCKEHAKPETIKWGISQSHRWCQECKKFIPLRIDMRGHP